MIMVKHIPVLCLFAVLLSACAGSSVTTATLTPFPALPSPTSAPLAATGAPLPATDTPTAAATLQSTLALTATQTPTSGPKPTLGPDAWKSLPVIPTGVSKRVLLIYQMGLMNGNNPKAYSKVGDCNVIMPDFMGNFDTPGKYTLAEYSNLQETIDYFAGSHSRRSMAAKQGLTAHAVLSMLWVDWNECSTNETPLTCEYRINKPMYALFAFGTNDANGNVDFEKALRRVIDMTIGNGTIPILSTKADNAEGDESINRTIAALANEYDLPLWNFWAAVQPLPLHGLMDEQHMEHLSQGPRGLLFDFSKDNLQYGWPMRNLTGLQMLDAVRRAVEAGQP